MKKRLSIRDLINQSWRLLSQNVIQWFLLFGIQLLVFFGFLLCCAASLAFLHYFFVDQCWFYCFFKGYSKIFTVSMISIVSIFSLFFTLVFPIMYQQNALDVVMDRSISGFDVNNRFFSYAVAMFVYWTLVVFGLCCGLFPGIFLAQRWRFVGLHLLDHGGSVRQAFRASWHMTGGYIWFLLGVSCMQWLLFVLCTPTLLLGVLAVAFNRLMDAVMYKQFHLEHDKGISVCVCEV